MRLAKVERNLAPQAGLWYTEAANIVVPERSGNYLRRETHLTGGKSMDTVSPHANNGNIPNASGIYKITCTANKRIYIGSAVNLRERRNGHFSALRRNEHINKHLQNAWNKYGPDAFKYEVIEFVLPMSLTAREQYWLNKLKPFGRKGFNIAREAGSTLGYKYAPEIVEKIRQQNIGRKQSPETIEKQRQASLGNKHSRGKNLGNKHALGHSHKQSPETRAKISQAKIGKEKSPAHREKLRQANLGKEQSAETIEKRRQSHLGTKRSPEARERMRQANLAAWQRRRNEHA